MEPDKNKMNQNTKPNGEEKIASPKFKNEEQWRTQAKHAGTSLLFTVLQGAAFAAGGILMKSAAQKLSSRTPKTDVFADNLLTVKRSSSANA